MNVDRIICAVCAIGAGVALTQPAVPQIQPAVIVKQTKPLMWDCSEWEKRERLRACNARKRSI